MAERYHDYFASLITEEGFTTIETTRFKDRLYGGYGILPDNLRSIKYGLGFHISQKPEGINGDFFVYDPTRITVKILAATSKRKLSSKVNQLGQGWTLERGQLYNSDTIIYTALAYKPLNSTSKN